MKLVRIKNEGCAIYPHNTIHQVLDLKDGVYLTLNERDRIPVGWCEEHIPGPQDIPYDSPCFKDCQGHFHQGDQSTFTRHCYSWNLFRTLGYYQNGTKTNYFEKEEYDEFEKYSKENNLDINKYE